MCCYENNRSDCSYSFIIGVGCSDAHAVIVAEVPALKIKILFFPANVSDYSCVLIT